MATENETPVEQPARQPMAPDSYGGRALQGMDTLRGALGLTGDDLSSWAKTVDHERVLNDFRAVGAVLESFTLLVKINYLAKLHGVEVSDAPTT